MAQHNGHGRTGKLRLDHFSFRKMSEQLLIMFFFTLSGVFHLNHFSYVMFKKGRIYVQMVSQPFFFCGVEDCGRSRGGITSVVMIDIIWTADSMMTPLRRLKTDTAPHPSCTRPSYVLQCSLGTIVLFLMSFKSLLYSIEKGKRLNPSRGSRFLCSYFLAV